MIDAINRQVVERLKVEFEMKGNGAHLRGGKCPSCEKKTLWTWVEKPGRIQCDRVGKCGFEATSKELFPELFENLNKNYQPTPEEPNKTANAYLSLIRGFEHTKLAGWYEQGKYWNPNADKGTATVKFWLDTEKTVYWERFIEDVQITTETGDKEKRNSGFKGAFKGLWWQPPTQQINPGDTIYITEGIFKAIALILTGYKAVSIMSAGSWPDAAFNAYKHQGINWVLALDNDMAGRKATKKHAAKIRSQREKVTCILSSDDTNKLDWDDLYKTGKLDRESMDLYRYYGDLELAQNISEKALTIWKRQPEKTYFCTHYNNHTYAVKVKTDEFEKIKADFLAPDANREQEAIEHAFISAASIKEIATFTMDFLYFQQPADGEDGQYFFRLNFANKAPEAQFAFPGKTFGSAGDFKKAVLQKAPGGQFIGGTNDLDYLYKNWLKKQPKIVKTIDYIGYDADTKTYVYSDYAVEQGNLITLNSESFFTLKKTAIKSTHDIKQQLTTHAPVNFIDDYRLAFGQKGMIVLTWWIGTLFAEQIRHSQRSYPFFEVFGEAGSGKSDMIDFLWKLFGRKSSTFNPNSSTMPGRQRHMSQVSNLPVVFNETDNDSDTEKNHFKKFSWEEQKDLFEGEFGRVTGVKTGDNATRLPVFRGALMAVQNPKITGTEAIISRFCGINFDRSHHTLPGKQASDRLNDLDIKQISGFLLNTLQKTDVVLKQFSASVSKHIKTLQQNPSIKLQRVMQNHAQLMALADCLPLILPVTADDVKNLHAAIVQMAVNKQEELNEDHPIVQQFWANFDYLNSSALDMYFNDHLMNHANEPEREIAVNLEHFGSQCEKLNLPRLANGDLRKYLCTSRIRKFVESKPIHSRIEKRTVRCWIFKTGK